jgi:hypothetical protein
VCTVSLGFFTIVYPPSDASASHSSSVNISARVVPSALAILPAATMEGVLYGKDRRASPVALGRGFFLNEGLVEQVIRKQRDEGSVVGW